MRRRFTNRLALIGLAVGWLAGAAQAQEAREADATERWYLLDVDGTSAGWLVSRAATRGDRLSTVNRLRLRFKRAGAEQSVEAESRFTETSDGRPLSAWSRQALGPTPIETTWKFLPHEVLVEVVHGDSSVSQRVPLPASGWLTPGQIQSRLRRLLADGVRHFTLSSFDPQLGLEVIDTEWIFEAEEELVIDGTAMATRRFRQRQSALPHLETIANVTADGLTVRAATPMMGFTMTSTLARRDDVLDSSDAPELMARTFIYPDRTIESPRRVRRAVFEVRTENGIAASLPSAGAQRVETISQTPASDGEGTGDGVMRVVVEVGSSPVVESIERADLEPYLRASTFIDHRDAGVRRLLGEADVPSDRPESERAESLRAFVAGHLEDKNLDSIMASAGEVADHRSGDCTEHSVLLVALLRAAGIPARAVTGLIYVDRFAGERDLFAYHMWTQAWADGRWLDLDATLEVPFDAAHIAIGTTALNDDLGTLAELARFATFIGQAGIHVVDYRIDGP